jgi:phytoene dehydrogenase-like protein
MNASVDSNFEDCDVLILGAGLGGLAAARALGARALVLERELRPGGLVRSEEHNDYIFDHTLHILYFPGQGDGSARDGDRRPSSRACPPEAWVETHAGIARFPIQLHLGSLETETAAACIHGIEAEEQAAGTHAPPSNFEDMLLRTFRASRSASCSSIPTIGRCGSVRSTTLAPSGFQWNIARPEMAAIKRGFENPMRSIGRTTPTAGTRSRRRVRRCAASSCSRTRSARDVDVRLGHEVTAIDTDARTVTVVHSRPLEDVPLTDRVHLDAAVARVAALCSGLPAPLKEACRTLTWNRVVTVACS